MGIACHVAVSPISRVARREAEVISSSDKKLHGYFLLWHQPGVDKA
jgi:hypothetical protein